MSTTTIASFILHFNFLTTAIMAFFAIYGLVGLVIGKLTKTAFQGRAFLKAFGLASLFALVLEVTVFNYPSHLKHFAGDEFYTIGISPQDSTILLTSDSTVSARREFRQKNDSIWAVSEIVFENLDRSVTSLYIKPIF